MVFIGLFVFLAAKAESEYTQTKSLLHGYKVKDVLMQQYNSIDAGETIKTAVKILLDGQSKNFLVTENSHPLGTLSRDEIIRALAEQGENVTIYNVMNKDLIILDADSPLENAYQQVQEHKTTLMPVVENNKLIGALDTENILEFIMVKDARAKSSNYGQKF